jgi:SsrA-binding protein
MNIILNKKARFNYQLTGKRVEAGIALSGAEAKTIREKQADLSRAVVRIMGNEIYLINANIPTLGSLKLRADRMRKLLLHRTEILSLATKAKQQKLTLVPVKLYTKGRLVKLEIALGKTKAKFEKKEAIKRKDIEREIEQQFKTR